MFTEGTETQKYRPVVRCATQREEAGPDIRVLRTGFEKVFRWSEL